MKIERIELLEIRMPLVHFFETSFGRTTDRRIVLLRVLADGLEGWGEVTCGESPFYSYETPGTAWHILRDFLIPWAFEKEWDDPSALAERFRPVRGHNMAKASLENALWDIEAQRKACRSRRCSAAHWRRLPVAFPSEFRTRLKNCWRKSGPKLRRDTSGSR